MRVQCSIEYVDTDDGPPGVQAVCDRCDHVTESYGTSSSSVRRCLVLMREECPNGENNFYKASGGEDEVDGGPGW